MVSVIKRQKGNYMYYYLRHNIRRNNRQKEIYLGKKIPQNIDKVKQNFLLEFYREEWNPKITEIIKNYSKQKKKLPKDALEKQVKSFSVKFTYNTQRIEGSTLTLKETSDLLEDGLTPSNRPNSDVKEAELHQKLFLKILKNNLDLSLKNLLGWHKELFVQTKPTIAGKVRGYDVGITRSKFKPPKYTAVNTFLGGFFKWYDNQKKILNPVELASLAHLKFVTIHPFGDGNGRISRLLMNFVLYKNNCPMLDIDYGDRKSYYNALERAQTKNDDLIFLQWFMRRYFKEYKNLLK